MITAGTQAQTVTQVSRHGHNVPVSLIEPAVEISSMKVKTNEDLETVHYECKACKR